MNSQVGMITIGQSPRTDITSDVKCTIGDSVDLVEIGALDELDPGADLAELSRGATKSTAVQYVTRLRDGRQVEITEEKLLPLLRKCVETLDGRGVWIKALLCTGEYPDLADVPGLVRPYALIHHLIDAAFPAGRLGVIVPGESQAGLKQKEWTTPRRECVVGVASPYVDSQLIPKVASDLAERGAQIIVLDCLGFSLDHKKRAMESAGRPVVLPRSVLAWTLKELTCQPERGNC